jgi:hypothetical protein
LLDTFGKFVQIAAGLIASSVLVVKRYKEKPRRPWKIWGLDVTKQATSMGAAHFVGMITATIMSEMSSDISACSWYFVAFTVDVTLGVTVSLVLLSLSKHLAVRKRVDALVTSGDYGQIVDANGVITKEPNYRIWAIQLLHWTFVCVVPARFVCMGTIYLLREPLSKVARGIASGFVGNPHAELVFVMIAGPLVMNAIQFLVQDAVLKYSKRGDQAEKASLIGGRDTSDQSFLRASRFSKLGMANQAGSPTNGDTDMMELEQENAHLSQFDVEANLLTLVEDANVDHGQNGLKNGDNHVNGATNGRNKSINSPHVASHRN